LFNVAAASLFNRLDPALLEIVPKFSKVPPALLIRELLLIVAEISLFNRMPPELMVTAPSFVTVPPALLMTLPEISIEASTALLIVPPLLIVPIVMMIPLLSMVPPELVRVIPLFTTRVQSSPIVRLPVSVKSMSR